MAQFMPFSPYQVAHPSQAASGWRDFTAISTASVSKLDAWIHCDPHLATGMLYQSCPVVKV
jgi:hypothetical protein